MENGGITAHMMIICIFWRVRRNSFLFHKDLGAGRYEDSRYSDEFYSWPVRLACFGGRVGRSRTPAGDREIRSPWYW